MYIVFIMNVFVFCIMIICMCIYKNIVSYCVIKLLGGVVND